MTQSQNEATEILLGLLDERLLLFPTWLEFGRMYILPSWDNMWPGNAVKSGKGNQNAKDSLSLINSELLAFPCESWNRVSYISQTLHKPMQLCFLKYVASQEHLCRGTQKPNSGKQAGWFLEMLWEERSLGNAGNRAVWKELKLPPWENENIYNKDMRKQDSEKPTEIQIEWTVDCLDCLGLFLLLFQKVHESKKRVNN